MNSKALIVGLTPPLEGGSERHIYEIASRMKNQTVLTQRGSICRNKIPLPILASFGGLIKNLSFFLMSSAYLILILLYPKKRFEVIHLHENLSYLLAPLLSLRYKVIITVHGLVGFRFYEKKSLWFFFRNSLKKATTIIVVSPAEREIVSQFHENVRFIPNGADIKLYEKISSPKVKKRVLFMGRIHKQKGIDILIEAFKLIKKDFPEYKLQIIGDKKGGFYESLRNSDIREKIIWTGFISDRKKLFTELTSAEILVYPSRWEALPWPALLEGLASGRPVIASNLKGMEEIFESEKNIFLVEPENAKALAKAIKTLLKDKKKSQPIGKKGRELSKNYDWSAIARKTEKVYNEI